MGRYCLVPVTTAILEDHHWWLTIGNLLSGQSLKTDFRPPFIQRHFLGRMGSVQLGQGSEWRVVPLGELGAHQVFRIESYPSRASILQGVTERENGGNSIRQHHCTFIPQEKGWHEVKFIQQAFIYIIWKPCLFSSFPIHFSYLLVYKYRYMYISLFIFSQLPTLS